MGVLGTHQEQAGLELIETVLPAFASEVLGFQASASEPSYLFVSDSQSRGLG